MRWCESGLTRLSATQFMVDFVDFAFLNHAHEKCQRTTIFILY
jgi:hypothetical protein